MARLGALLQKPDVARSSLRSIVWLAVVAVHGALLISVAAELVLTGVASRALSDIVVFLVLSTALATATLALKSWKFVWILPPVQAILAGFVAVSSPSSLVFHTILVAAALLEVVLIWHGRARLAVAAACVAVSALVLVRYDGTSALVLGEGAGSALIGMTIALAIAFADTALLKLARSEEAVTTLREAIGRISEANVQYQDYAVKIAEESSLEERRRISRDLHDVVGLTFTNIIAMMNAVLSQPFASREEQEELFKWIRDTAQSGLQDTRGILYELRYAPQQRRPTVEVIGRIVGAFERATDMSVVVEWGNLPFYLPQAVHSAVTHLIQEALVNAFRHGRAAHVQLYFTVSDQVLHISVIDNGNGGTTDESGIGQTGIAERLETLAGTVKFRSSARGYRVDATVPLSGADS